MANWYVWKAVLFASMGALLVGLFIGSLNGMFEMNGFQNSFQELFPPADNCSTSAPSILPKCTSNEPSHRASITTPEHVSTSSFGNGTTKDLQCGRCSSTKSCSGGTGASANGILGLMISVANLGAVLGALLAGWLSTKTGRKMSLVGSGGLFIVGAGLTGLGFYSWLFIIGRIISGIGMGLIYVVMPVYISEMSPKKSRGLLTSTIGPIYCMGILMAVGLNCVFTKFCLGWRIHMAIQVIIGLIFSIGMFFQPRTPRWLVLNKRNGEAHLVLSRINSSSLDKNSIDTCLQLEELKGTTNTFLSQNYFTDFVRQMRILLQWKFYQRFMLSLLLFMVSGPIGNFTYYFASTFFCHLNISGCLPSIIVGIFLLIGSCISFFLIDKVGRKLILLLSIPLLIFMVIIVSSLSQVFNLEEDTNEVVGYIIVTLFCLYAMVYSLSWVTIPWVISSEIFSVEARGTTIAITSSVYWIFSFLSTQIVPLIINSFLGITGFFYILLVINIFSFMIPLLGLPETKGVSLEEMEALFNKPWLHRMNLVYYLSCGISKMYKKTSENDAAVDNEDIGEYKQKEVL